MEIDIDYALGETLLEDVLQPSGNSIYLMKSGDILAKKDIEYLKRQGINKVVIDADNMNETFNEVLVSKVSKAIKENDFKTLVTLAKVYRDIAEGVTVIKHDMSKYISFREVSPLLLSVLNTNLAVTLTKKYNETFGKSHRISLDDIALAAMTQDIGLSVSNNELYFSSITAAYQEDYKSLITKYPVLKEDYLICYCRELHPLYSYYIIKGYHFKPVVEKAVLWHNEVYDNKDSNTISGILNISLKDEEDVDAANMAMILKAVDIYNRLLLKGKKQNSNCPFADVPRSLETMVANGVLSPEVVNIMKEVIPLFPEGTLVKLNDGTVAKVSSSDGMSLLKPKLIDLEGNEINYHDNLEVLYPLSIDEIKRRQSI